MKNTKLFLSAILLFYITGISLNAQLEVATNGNVGIGGVSPDSYYDLFTQKAKFQYDVLFYNGSYPGIIATSYYNVKSLRPTSNNSCSIGTSYYYFKDIYTQNSVHTSDFRAKENIQNITNSIDIVKQLQPVKYDFKSEYTYLSNIDYTDEMRAKEEKHRKDRFGFIAQDVEEILPSLVYHDDSISNFGINYTDIIPILTSAIQEQQQQIETLKQELDNLKGIESVKKSLTSIEDDILLNGCKLFQNNPNPFGETTSIRYKLPKGNVNANIILYDMTGKQLNRIPLTESGESRVNISAGELESGMYMYSLIVENQLVDTKQLVITE